jgi:archaeosine-15-forming tRNA-guanine transglycosylase
MGKALALGLLLVVAATGGDASGAKRKPRPIRILEPGALTFDYRGGLLVADRKLHRVVRINLRTGKRRVILAGLRDIVGLAVDDQLRLHVAAGDRIYRLAGGRKTVIAGNGQRGHTGDGGPATAASFGGIGGFEVDHDKSIVVAEYDNWIRFVDPNGSVSTIAGNGEEGYAGDGGPARVAVLRHPHDLALRIDREVIVADSHNGVLRRIDPSGTITTFATGFLAPIAVKGGAGNSLYVADGGQNAVFRLSADGRSRRRVVRANGPINLAVDDKDNVYVSEIAGARRVLRVSPSGRVRVLVR